MENAPLGNGVLLCFCAVSYYFMCSSFLVLPPASSASVTAVCVAALPLLLLRQRHDIFLPSRAILQWPTWTVSEAAHGDSFSVSQRLLCNFHQTRRVWNRHLCSHNVLSSSRYANVVLSSLLDLGSATRHYFLLMLCSFTNKVLARLDLLICGHELRPAGVNGWFQVASIGTAVSKQTSPLPQRAISTSSIWSTWRCSSLGTPDL